MDIPVGSQIFDLCFAPKQQVVFTAALNGEIKAFEYDDDGQHQHKFTLRPNKKSCRGLAISAEELYAVGKAKSLIAIDIPTATISNTRLAVHDVPINRIKRLRPHILATGDDDGVVKLWDTRKPEPVRAYTHHFDFISDFLWLEDKKQLVCTSGDGTLSVLDIRSSQKTPLAQSEDQEDELLSIVPIKGGTKFVVGTQSGVLSIFARARGWGDCVDRVPGHPSSVDALCALPTTAYPSAQTTVLTGASDGLVRVVSLFPTRMLGVLCDHGEMPVERVVVERAGEGRWVGSVAHEGVLRMTDLREALEDENQKEDQDEEEGEDTDDDEDAAAPTLAAKPAEEDKDDENENASGSDEDSDAPKERKRKRRGKDRDPLAAPGKRKKGRNELELEAGAFADL